ncbi:MAG TPA: glycosyltransferase family 39 protein [Gemmatimonadales bacterium]|nr:glycosyltransferase family 39 protein [Gemmatimonadales bacterium]
MKLRRPADPWMHLPWIAVLLLHLLVNVVTPYGFHRDEFLYLAMGRHLELFGMDFPPFIAIAARGTLATLGGSLPAVRFLPAVAGALLVLLAALLARRFGGGRYAQLAAALAVAISPLFLRAGSLFQPVVFDALWWSFALLVLARLAEAKSHGTPADRRDWLLLGVVLGLGLLTKFSIAFIGIGLIVAILLTPLRRALLTPGPWLALGIALLIGSPGIVGQIRLGLPVLGQMRDLQAEQLERVSPLVFLAGQVEMFQPLILLALAGAFHLARSRHRPVLIACAATFLLLLWLRGKAYYIGPVYPALLAAGAVQLEAVATGRRRLGAALWRGIPLVVILGFGAIAFPLAVPILPPAATARYAGAIGVTSTTNTGEPIALPQDYADMLGWEDQVAATKRAIDSLPARDRADLVVIGTNYGRAGAHDHLGAALGLPPAVAPMGSYWFFGPGPKPGRVALIIGGEREELTPFYRSVTPVARVTGEWRVPEERDVTLWIGRDPVRSLQEIWETFRGQN